MNIEEYFNIATISVDHYKTNTIVTTSEKCLLCTG